jgi:chemotaxis protein MotB
MIEEDPPAGVPEWVVTYGDMMSLLLTFFIMLVSLSSMKQDGQLRAMMDAISETFGAHNGEYGAPGNSSQTSSVLDKLGSLGFHSEGGTKKSNRATKGGGGPNLPVSTIGEGTVVTLGGPAMFPRFSATLTDELKKNLDVIANVVADKPNRIDVRGHASPEPLPEGSPFRDQLDLSFARAHNVAMYLISKRIEPGRILVSAAADVEPRRVTRDKNGQMLNHRVDVFLIDSYITPSDLREPAEK